MGLIQYGWCPCKKRKFGHSHTETLRHRKAPSADGERGLGHPSCTPGRSVRRRGGRGPGVRLQAWAGQVGTLFIRDGHLCLHRAGW